MLSGSAEPLASNATLALVCAVVGVIVKLAVGFWFVGSGAVIVICRVVVPVPPLASVTVSVTVKVLAVVNVCVGATPVPAAVPSPKFQA